MTVVFNENRGRNGAGCDDTDRCASSKQCPSIERGSGYHNVTRPSPRVSYIACLISINNVPSPARLFTSWGLWLKVAVQWSRTTTKGAL